MNTVLDRFTETLTGKRRLTLNELGRIRQHWPEAMRRVVEIGTASPKTQHRSAALPTMACS